MSNIYRALAAPRQTEHESHSQALRAGLNARLISRYDSRPLQAGRPRWHWPLSSRRLWSSVTEGLDTRRRKLLSPSLSIACAVLAPKADTCPPKQAHQAHPVGSKTWTRISAHTKSYLALPDDRYW